MAHPQQRDFAVRLRFTIGEQLLRPKGHYRARRDFQSKGLEIIGPFADLIHDRYVSQRNRNVQVIVDALDVKHGGQKNRQFRALFKVFRRLTT